MIERSLRLINAIGKGQSLSAEEADDALRAINSNLASESVESPIIFTETIETFNLSGVSSYTIGSGQTFDTTVPNDIISVTVKTGDIDYTLTPYDAKAYSEIKFKNTNGIPDIYYYDGGYPSAKLYLYPVPLSGTVTLYTRKPLSSFSSLDDAFSMPPEYQAYIEYNGAVWLAPEYETIPQPGVIKMANRTRNAVKIKNRKNEQNFAKLNIPSRSDIHSNIYQGDY